MELKDLSQGIDQSLKEAVLRSGKNRKIENCELLSQVRKVAKELDEWNRRRNKRGGNRARKEGGYVPLSLSRLHREEFRR